MDWEKSDHDMERIIGTFDGLSANVAEYIIKKLRDMSNTKDNIILALPGGRSVVKIYEEFSKSRDAVWKKTHIFLIDERADAINSLNSNLKLIKETFADTLIKNNILPSDNLHPLIINPDENDQGASKYYAELMKFGGRFDIALVASGEDGHVAALFPRHRTLQIEEDAYIYFNDGPKPPPQRITCSKKLIMDARSVVLLFIGDTKLDAYKRFLDEKIIARDCPAKYVLQADECLIATDRIL